MIIDTKPEIQEIKSNIIIQPINAGVIIANFN